jgi:4-aminobutyrate aminotransferase-like enzyme
VVVEPIQGRAGVRVPPDGFMSALSTLARRAGVLVVADEVLTGMGRCGPTFASTLVGLKPDVICVGKALGAGLPVSACLADESVMRAWPESTGEAIHTSTFLGHPLGCAAALAALDQWAPEVREARVVERGEQLLAGLARGLAGVRGVGSVRGAGLLVAIELVEPDGVAPDVGAAVRIASAVLRQGLLVLPAGEHGQVVELTPPLVVTDEQMDFGVDVLVRTVAGQP